jgi:hypothetical protein
MSEDKQHECMVSLLGTINSMFTDFMIFHKAHGGKVTSEQIMNEYCRHWDNDLKKLISEMRKDTDAHINKEVAANMSDGYPVVYQCCFYDKLEEIREILSRRDYSQEYSN